MTIDTTTVTRTVRVGTLTRVEGEGALNVTLRDHALESVQLNIYEPPRFFEAFLRGRKYTEPPDITARICGICPVAYQTSACNAIEQACGVTVDPALVELRRLLYCGEWIHSHALHIYLLNGPDFLGYPDAISLARDHREAVERGLALKKAGNRLQELIGGRAIHPINVRLGGFYSVPTRGQLDAMAEELRRALDHALDTVRWVSEFEFPELEFEHELLSLSQPGRYPIENGTIVRSGGPGFSAAEFCDHVAESHVPHSTALHATLDGRPHLTGPLARYSLNASLLSPIARQAAAEAGLTPECRNPFRAIVARSVEVVYAIEEALRIIDAYERPARPFVDVPPRHGRRPRGQRSAARPALSPIRGQRRRAHCGGHHRAAHGAEPGRDRNRYGPLISANLDVADEQLTGLCENLIRTYDPCISCSAHFLTLTVRRM